MLKHLLSSVALTAFISSAAFAEVNVENAYARAVPPGQSNSALFLTLSNTDSTDMRLVSASAKNIKYVELHNHINTNGVMKMRPVKEITIPAKHSVELKPGGYHIMLIGLEESYTEGNYVELQLDFADGTSLQLQVPIKNVLKHAAHHEHGAAGHPADQHGSHHHNSHDDHQHH